MAGQGLHRWVTVVGTVAAVVVLSAAPAFAHVSLEAAEPAAGAAVSDAPAIVALTFDGALQADGDHAVGLFGPSGAQVDDGRTVQPTDRAVQVGVGELGEVGTYTVRWLVAGADGHNIEGEYTFAYDGPVVTVGTPPSASPQPAPAESDDASLTPSNESEPAGEELIATRSPEADPTEVTATPAPAEPGGGAGALVPAAIGVAGVLGVGAVLLRRRGGAAT